ncbi:MAG: tRNA(Ile)-lysidine synthetase, partial [Clostridia bacterium]|nr:tRNA(Ile)-lysidine synthetase [Clostridia bacterium]
MQDIRSALISCGLWREDAVLLCAFSGGCDSVALLHALSRLRKEQPFTLHALHVQHNL